MAGRLEASAEPVQEQRWNRLLREHGPPLTRLAGSYTRSTSDRDDLLQEIAMAIWQALPSFRGECSERTFLYRIAHNRAIAYIARRRRDTEPAGDELEAADPAPDPETALVHQEGGRHLARAVQALPILYRQVVVLMLEGMDYAEIADIIGISESNVGVRLNRARQMLRRIMT